MKLTNLTPAGFGTHVERAARLLLGSLREQWQRDCDWAGRVAMALAPGYEVVLREPSINVSEARGSTDLGLTAVSLCAYAQTGQGWSDVPTDDVDQAQAAEDALIALLSVLDRGAHDARVPESWVREQDATDVVALVARAALARIALARGDDVQRSWLAALTGLSDSRVRTLINEEVLEALPVERGGAEKALSPIRHASAKTWLRARDPNT